MCACGAKLAVQGMGGPIKLYSVSFRDGIRPLRKTIKSHSLTCGTVATTHNVHTFSTLVDYL